MERLLLRLQSKAVGGNKSHHISLHVGQVLSKYYSWIVVKHNPNHSKAVLSCQGQPLMWGCNDSVLISPEKMWDNGLSFWGVIECVHSIEWNTKDIRFTCVGTCVYTLPLRLKVIHVTWDCAVVVGGTFDQSAKNWGLLPLPLLLMVHVFKYKQLIDIVSSSLWYVIGWKGGGGSPCICGG